MSAKIDIANMALSHIAVGEEINDFDTEKTEAAQACRRFYDVARQKVLRDFDWPFANTIEALALVATAPTVEWGYSYRYPATSLAIRRILNGATRVDTQLSRTRYSVGRDATGRILYADLASPLQLQYTYDETNTERFTPDFVLALSFYLAFLIAPRVTGGTNIKELSGRAFAVYQQSIREAWANAANEEPRDEPPEAEMIRARG